MWAAVLGAALPVLLLWVVLSIVHDHPAGLDQVVGNGELFLIAAVLTVGNLEKLRRRSGFAEFLHGVALFIVIGSLVAWSTVVAKQTRHPTDLRSLAAYAGAGVLVAALICGAACRGLTAEEGKGTAG